MLNYIFRLTFARVVVAGLYTSLSTENNPEKTRARGRELFDDFKVCFEFYGVLCKFWIIFLHGFEWYFTYFNFILIASLNTFE